MSYVEVYGIRSNGDVKSIGEVRNAQAGAAYIWDEITKKYLGEDSPALYARDPKELWALFGDPRLSENESLVLGFTYDSYWVSYRDIPRLVAALEDFWSRHHSSKSIFGKRETREINPTIPGISKLISDFHKDPELVGGIVNPRGICFNQTSVCENPWRVLVPRIPYADAVKLDPTLVAEDYCSSGHDYRPFNFDTDDVTVHRIRPKNLIEELTRKQGIHHA